MLTSGDPSGSNHARTRNRLPQRAPKVPKNRTGIFVETQNGSQRVPYRSIPPLARPRGVPAPSYTNRYSTESSGQKQVVQNIRARQEWKGGFFPKPVKKSRNKQLHERIDYRPSPHLLQGLPDYRDLTRRSARNFVAASNNGVTHLEDLRSESMSSFSVQSETTYDDMSSIAGLEEVYKKIIKEERSTQLSNKERRVVRLKSEKNQSPLVIRSFRNPQNPHPVIQYSDVRQRSSSSRDHCVSQPPVPAPFFYNSRTLLKAADHGGSRVHLSRLSGARSSDHILAAPGAGILTKSVLGVTREHIAPPCIEGQPPPVFSPRGKLTESDERIGMMGTFRVPSTTPATSTPDLQKALEDDNKNNPVVLPDYRDDETDDHSIVQTETGCTDDGKILSPMNSGIIMLSLETDEGVSKVISLEEEEERNKQDVIEYHAAQRALQGNAEDEIVEGKMTDKHTKEDSSDEVPRELNQLLHEHSEIVNQIHQLEKLTCSDDDDDETG